MARLYTEETIAKTLEKLQILPENGMVDGSEAARILTWRAKKEYGIDYTYTPSSVRQHARPRKRKDGKETPGSFPPGTVDNSNERKSLYQVEAVFKLPITPKRGIGKKKEISQTS